MHVSFFEILIDLTKRAVLSLGIIRPMSRRGTGILCNHRIYLGFWEPPSDDRILEPGYVSWGSWDSHWCVFQEGGSTLDVARIKGLGPGA